MMRNDYRRALILLRSNASSYSGHVRLERRTLMGSMYFVVQAPEAAENLRAALVGRDRNGYYACALGQFRRDSRGQAVLSHSFDPGLCRPPHAPQIPCAPNQLRRIGHILPLLP